MNCKCKEEMKDLGTGPGGTYLRWCPSCGRLFERSMNPGLPREAWSEPAKQLELAQLVKAMENAEQRGMPIKELLAAFQTVQAEWAKWVERFEKLAIHSEKMKRKLENELALKQAAITSSARGEATQQLAGADQALVAQEETVSDLRERLEKINELARDLDGARGQDIRSLSLLEEDKP